MVASIWGRSVEQYAEAADLLAEAPAAVIAVEVNLSCPNLDGGSHLFAHDAGLAAAAIAATAGCGRPRWAKLSPNTPDLVDIAGAVADAGAEAVTLVNTVQATLPDDERAAPRFGGGGGGLSGPAIHPVALRAVHDGSGRPSRPAHRGRGWGHRRRHGARPAGRRGRRDPGRDSHLRPSGCAIPGAGSTRNVVPSHPNPTLARADRNDALSEAPEAVVPNELRQKLCLALDVDDLVAANRLARDLKPYFGVVKIGLELFTAVGPDAIGTMMDQGYKVFVDLKLHDIPNTVERAAKVLGSLGASYLTMHAHGGAPMLRAGVTGFHEGAANAGLPEPVAVAVTVLTSDSDAPEHIIPKRVRVAAEGGCQAIVCAVGDLADVRTLTPRLIKVVPGIRPEGAPADDQVRVGTPQEALDEGADLLVIGRPITRADDPVQAATELVASVG